MPSQGQDAAPRDVGTIDGPFLALGVGTLKPEVFTEPAGTGTKTTPQDQEWCNGLDTFRQSASVLDESLTICLGSRAAKVRRPVAVRQMVRNRSAKGNAFQTVHLTESSGAGRSRETRGAQRMTPQALSGLVPEDEGVKPATTYQVRLTTKAVALSARSLPPACVFNRVQWLFLDAARHNGKSGAPVGGFS
ncbi:hypothetical protein LY76DRAFT_606696 [Colletotrichum caudatum]|nr:hypothetical protein LY76DRAFT_606696 [Colletotrichum caudatum]